MNRAMSTVTRLQTGRQGFDSR